MFGCFLLIWIPFLWMIEWRFWSRTKSLSNRHPHPIWDLTWHTISEGLGLDTLYQHRILIYISMFSHFKQTPCLLLEEKSTWWVWFLYKVIFWTLILPNLRYSVRESSLFRVSILYFFHGRWSWHIVIQENTFISRLPQLTMASRIDKPYWLGLYSKSEFTNSSWFPKIGSLVPGINNAYHQNNTCLPKTRARDQYSSPFPGYRIRRNSIPGPRPAVYLKHSLGNRTSSTIFAKKWHVHKRSDCYNHGHSGRAITVAYYALPNKT